MDLPTELTKKNKKRKNLFSTENKFHKSYTENS